MIEGQFEAEIKKEFSALTKTVERMAHVVIDRIDRMDGGHLSNIMTSVELMTAKVEAAQKSLDKFAKDMQSLEIQIARLNSKIDLATQGRTQWSNES
jgi:hypothetical protein